MSANAVVVGAGFGGLAAAIGLAARGVAVQVVEAGAGPGGKADVAVLEGVEVDTGPSVLTLPEVFDAVFRLAGSSLKDEIALVEPTAGSPSFRYHFADGARVDIFVAAEDTVASVGRSLGSEAAQDLARFLQDARTIWEAAAPHFVLGPPPAFWNLMSFEALIALLHIDPLRTMQSGIARRVRSPHLRRVLWRYATYNGSDPRRAPATLNCIAHVELALGGFGVRGGVHALVRALVSAAQRLGVEFQWDSPVTRIDVQSGRARGVEVRGKLLPADIVVANADAAHVSQDLLAKGQLPLRASQASLSGWTGVLRAQNLIGRAAHTVVFPEDYQAEFVDMFDRNRAPSDPAVYLCAQDLAHERPSWPDSQPVFVMANAPAGCAEVAELEVAALQRARAAGLLQPDDRLLWSRTPQELAARFPGSQGSLYGAASNGPWAAFARPANRASKVRGLYLASGSAHPGGGMPLCARSGLTAAECATDDLRAGRTLAQPLARLEERR